MIYKLRILFLGASYAQIPIIQEAKNRGWYIITCDYLPDNPGHELANEFHNVSTTDFAGVLQLAKRVNPDLVVAYASDPAAPTAAWVSEQLNLPGNTYKSVQLLSEKDLFRKVLADNGFNTPNYIILTKVEDVEKLKSFTFPIIIKPTDSSGSKGVSKVENFGQTNRAIDYALSFSRKKRIIAEEFVGNDNGDIHGDGFVINSKLCFCHLGDHIYNVKSNEFNPCGTVWPSCLNNQVISQIENEVESILKLTGYKNGPINIEARINSEGNIYIMEIGPRSGGHFVPQAIEYSTDFNMIRATLDVLSGNEVIIPAKRNLFTSYYAIHSDVEGKLKNLEIKPELKSYIKEFHQYLQPGEKISSYTGANAAIGVMLFLFKTRQEMDFYMRNIKKYHKIELEESQSIGLKIKLNILRE
jgi:biotin carboxylase